MAESPARRPLTIGLTGGIASGKTSVADLFAELGVPVIDTDVIAREIVEPGEPALDAIRDTFGAELLEADGRLDRARLRELVFSDPAKRHQLEAILHPRIRQRTLERAGSVDAPYLVIVVPLLLETGFSELMDRVLVVDCDEAEQRRRLLARDGESEQQANRIMAAQVSRDARLAAADDVIDNSGSLDSTRAQVEALHLRYLDIAGRQPAP